MEAEFCELCRVTDESEHKVVCAKCVDKAAEHDILRRDKRFLYHGVCAMVNPLKDAQEVLQKVSCQVSKDAADKIGAALLGVSVCVGRVEVMIEDCAPVKADGQKGE